MIITFEMREEIHGMMYEVITQDLGNRERNVDGDHTTILSATNDTK